ncbi:hypothetical protein ACFE04_014641 [Oxalis oulophora]
MATNGVFDGLKAVIVMVLTQSILSGVNIFYKLAVVDGMSMRVLIAYRFIFATIFVLPLALLIERNKRPRLTWMIGFLGLLSGLFGGSLGQNLYIESLSLTSATFVAAMANLIPAVTFTLAISFRLEKLSFKNLSGNAKALGVFLGIGGAMVLTFYKGLEIEIWSSKITLIKHPHDHHTSTSTIKTDQHHSSQQFMQCVSRRTGLFGNLAGTLGLFMSLIRLVCERKRSIFRINVQPPSLSICAFLGSVLLDEKLYLGTILGSVLIIMGLYAVFYGKECERKIMTTQESIHESIK